MPHNTQGIGARVRLLDRAVPMQSQEMICGGCYLYGSDPELVFAAGSLTNQPRIEVFWRSAKRSVITNALPNCLCEIDEPSAPRSAAVPATENPHPSQRIRSCSNASIVHPPERAIL